MQQNNPEVPFSFNDPFLLSKDELDVLYAVQASLINALERNTIQIQRHFEAKFRQTEDYKQMVKQFGKQRTNDTLKDKVQMVVRHEDKVNVSNILSRSNSLLSELDKATDATNKWHDSDVKDTDVFDVLLSKGSFICRLILYLFNSSNTENLKERALKIESTLKSFSRGSYVTQKLLNAFKSE